MEQVKANHSTILQYPEHKIRNLFLVFALIALTGFEFFFRADYLWVPLALYTGFLFIQAKKLIDKTFINILIAFMAISLIRGVVFNSVIPSAVCFVQFWTYYFIATLVGRDFITYFIKILLFFSITSLFFWFLQYNDLHQFVVDYVAPYFPALSKDGTAVDPESVNIIIHKYFHLEFIEESVRNSGPFWEPGLFVGFIAIAFFFNLNIKKRLLSMSNIIFITAIITTFSSTGYLLLFVIVCSYFAFSSKSKIKYLIIPLWVLFAISIYVTTNFMKDKINAQYDTAQEDPMNRFGAALIHFNMIEKSPLIGYMIAPEDMKKLDASSLSNGLTNVIVAWGIPLAILYYILLATVCIRFSIYYMHRKELGIAFFILLLLFGFSQDITTRHLYYFFIISGMTQFKLSKQLSPFNKLQEHEAI